MKLRTLINLESPYAGNIELNTLYAQFCMHDSIVNRDEAPFASHLLYTQPNVLRDEIPEERKMGIDAGRDFSYATKKTVLYSDLGMTDGMKYAADHAQVTNHPVEVRFLPADLWNRFVEEARDIGYHVNKEHFIDKT